MLPRIVKMLVVSDAAQDGEDEKLCQYRQHRTSNTHRAELIENALMVNSIKGCTKINLHHPSLFPTLQCTLQCMGDAQKCITGTKTYPMSKLGGWITPLRSINRIR